MSDVAAIIADMVRAGVDPELIGRTAAALSQNVQNVQIVQDPVADRRRAYDRERKAAAKALRSTGIPPESADSVEHNLSPKETSPTPPKEITPIHSVSEASASSTVRPEPAKAAPVAVICLPTVSDGDFPVTADDIAEWQTAFPAVNVRQQLASMRQWLIANQTKRKTARGMKRFVVSWLDRKQNEGGAVPSPRGQGPPYPARTVSDVLGEMAAGTWTGPRESLPNEPFIETSFTRRN